MSASHLILVPTELERSRIEAVLSFDRSRCTVHTIGFGLIAAAIETSVLLHRHRPDAVTLAGIAGLFPQHQDDRKTIGSAIWFDTVAVDGIGAGQGDRFRDARQLGWQWATTSETDANDESGVLTCHRLGNAEGRTLLSVCAASADQLEANWRASRFPEAIGEDMEAFAVLFACKRLGVRCEIVRGFSNLVGRREKSEWRIDEALEAVGIELQRRIDGEYK